MSSTQIGQLTNSATIKRAGEYIPGGALGSFALPEEVAFTVARAKGSRVWDVEGNAYIDYILGSGPMVIGHTHPAVVDAVKRQVELGSTFYVLNSVAVDLAEKIVRAAPCAEKLKFVNTGTEATYYALRLARAFTGKDKVLKFEGGYHGGHDYSAMSQTPADPANLPNPIPDSAGIPGAVAGEVLVAEYNDVDGACSLIRERAGELAAVIVEPVQRSISPRPGFLQELRKVTAETGVALIFDEVVTGFRLAYGGAQEYFGVTPDLATYGKTIGGGYPIGAIGGREEIMSLCDPRNKGRSDYVYISGTFSGNPVTAAAGMATLAELERPGAYERLNQVGKTLRKGMTEIAARLSVPAQVTGEGAIFQFYFTDRPIVNYRDTLAADAKKAKRLGVELIRRGILTTGQKGYISLAHSDKDLGDTLVAFEDALKETMAS